LKVITVLAETTSEKLAARMLSLTGIAAIWDAHVAAAAAHGLGEVEMAASLMEIAEAAERLWLARESAKAK
jgi:hypothetical protein